MKKNTNNRIKLIKKVRYLSIRTTKTPIQIYGEGWVGEHYDDYRASKIQSLSVCDANYKTLLKKEFWVFQHPYLIYFDFLKFRISY